MYRIKTDEENIIARKRKVDQRKRYNKSGAFHVCTQHIKAFANT